MNQLRRMSIVCLLIAVIALQATVSFAAPTTFTGAVETDDLTAYDRIDRNGIPSTCEAPTTYPGTVELVWLQFRYDSHSYTNTDTQPICVTATLEVTSMAPLHAIVYLGSFNPENQAENYLADSGNSASSLLGTVTFSFMLDAGQTAVFILQEVGNDGVPEKPYTLTIEQPDSTPPDVAAPDVTVPASITVPATGPDGAVVTFDVSAVDETDGAVAANCDWTSGAVFPVGTTTVTCDATDNAGNTGSATFTVTVVGGQELLAQLRADTIALVNNASTERSMIAAIDLARVLLANDNPQMAQLMLVQYDLHLTRAVSTRSLSSRDANLLRTQLALVRDAIS